MHTISRIGEWLALLPLWRRIIKDPLWHVPAAIGTGIAWFILIIALGLASGCGDEEPKKAAAKLSPAPRAEETTQAPTPTQVSEPTQTPIAATPSPTVTEVELKLAAFDYTETKPPGDEAELWTTGLGSWHPDLTFGGDDTIIGPYKAGSSQELFVYPDGRDGLEIKVILTLTEDMISRSDRDTVHIEIYDSTVKVWGTAIQGHEQEFAR